MRNRRFRNRDWSDPEWQEEMKLHHEHRQKNKRFFGMALAVVGLAWIATIVMKISLEFDNVWPYGAIILGLLIGIKNGFRRSPWWLLIIIGAANLVDRYYPNHQELIWASSLVVGGIVIAMRPLNKPCAKRWNVDKVISTDANLNMDITFGGRKEVITAKDFKGGVISVTFGGCEINFMQADFAGPEAILDLRISFGGVEVIVPSHWEIRNEISPSFGNVEDERTIQTATSSENRKVLILRGSCSFGNIEIKSY